MRRPVCQVEAMACAACSMAVVLAALRYCRKAATALSTTLTVRFCRSMGYDGLADFKLKLAGSVSEGVPFIHRSVDTDDPCEGPWIGQHQAGHALFGGSKRGQRGGDAVQH